MKFRKLPNTGIHVHRTVDKDGAVEQTLVNDGDTIEADVDLCVKFPKKFENLDKASVEASGVVHKSADAANETDASKTANNDVTAQFKNAADLGLTVLKQGRQFVVFKGTDQVNETPTNKGGVIALIEELVEAGIENEE